MLAASGGVTGPLQGLDCVYCSVQERHKSIAEVGLGARRKGKLEAMTAKAANRGLGLGALVQLCRSRIRCVATSRSVTGALQELDCMRRSLQERGRTRSSQEAHRSAAEKGSRALQRRVASQERTSRSNDGESREQRLGPEGVSGARLGALQFSSLT